MTLKELKEAFDKEYDMDISKKTRERIYANARKAFAIVATSFYKDIADIAEVINVSRVTVSNMLYQAHALREKDLRTISKIKAKFRDNEIFTTLNGHKIEGNALNNLMIELSTWEEHRVIELIETKVKPFKRENYL
jgi:hypothetical protein